VSNAFLIVIVFNAQRSTHDGSTESRPTIFLISDHRPAANGRPRLFRGCPLPRRLLAKAFGVARRRRDL
jgi:hypothetical protein